MTLLKHYENLVAQGTLTADTAQHDAIAAFDALIVDLVAAKRRRFAFWRTRETPQGLYLWGGVGRGKTMLMDMAATALDDAGIKSRRFHFHEFMGHVHDKVHDPALAKVAEPARHVAASIADGAQVLCFDEMEIRDIADAMIVARVMEGFMEAGGVLIATSNRHPDDLYEGGLHRARFLPFIDLIKSRMVVHELASPNDWRQQRLAQIKRWFQGDAATTLPLMENEFNTLVCGLESAPGVLTIKGRAIDLPKVAGSVVFAQFDDLCARPLAARDYLGLAQRFAGVFLHDIPVMDDNLRNEARRFIWLIDALYDKKRFLIGSSVGAMTELYRGELWEAEFPRALSRLSEMTSDFVAR